MFKHMKELRREVGSDDVILSLSLGKDSVACLILLNMVFKNIYCMVGEQLPGRPSDRRYAEYLQNKFPSIRKINFYPHPLFLDKLNEGAFKSHKQLKDPFFEGHGEGEEYEYKYDYSGMRNNLALECGLNPLETYQAVGVKMSDSMQRRIALTRMGYVKREDKTIYPVRDYTPRSIYELIKYKGLRLHEDYKYYGSSFDGMAAKYWVKAYRSDPETWEWIEKYYPMAKTYVYKDIFKRRMNEDQVRSNS